MEDKQIVELYWQRSERAITETQTKYGRYCYAIAHKILGNAEDAEECVNDTYNGAWNAMPPHKPEILSTFLGKITRRLSLKKWREKTAEKRGGGVAALTLEELRECVPAEGGVERELRDRELAGVINAFLAGLSDTERRLFVCRYWYFDSIRDMAKRFGFGESKVKMTLKRTRDKLLDRLREEELYP